MGTPSSKSRRKNREFKVNKEKQQRALNVVSSINQRNEEPSAEPPVIQQKAQPKIEISRDIGINSLPRQNIGSEQIIRAIDDVNKRLSKSLENKTKSNDNTDQEIEHFVRKIKQKVNKSETNQINKTNLSHIYSKLGSNSPISMCKNNFNLNQKQRELVIRDLRQLENKADKNKSNSLHKERLSLLKQINFDSDSGISNEDEFIKVKRDLTRIKPVPGLEDTYCKAYSAIRQLDDLLDDECSEPIYDKPNDLRQIDIRPDVDLLKIAKSCKTIHDFYKVDSDEIRQIIEFIEKKDVENGEERTGCSYYMKGDEIYSTKHEQDAKKKARFNAPTIGSNKVSNETLNDKNEKICRQILNDMVLNYALENDQKLSEKKHVHFSSNSCFKPIKKDSKIPLFQSDKKKPDDTMPNVTMFIESLDKQNRN